MEKKKNSKSGLQRSIFKRPSFTVITIYGSYIIHIQKKKTFRAVYTRTRANYITAINTFELLRDRIPLEKRSFAIYVFYIYFFSSSLPIRCLYTPPLVESYTLRARYLLRIAKKRILGIFKGTSQRASSIFQSIPLLSSQPL